MMTGDVHLDVGGGLVPAVARIVHRIRVEAERPHRLAQMHPVLVDGIEHRRVQSAGDRPAAEQRRLEPDPFLVADANVIFGQIEPSAETDVFIAVVEPDG